ncbi:uncharacterized protein LOC135006019 isoform X3 [Pseudophryne corroboree]|uniref:uncharacterized protein LOC135006019 isoform X3 n=1 Tax=Pseudophryne corroboree TaxID=495146 RepID=UPI00308209AA
MMTLTLVIHLQHLEIYMDKQGSKTKRKSWKGNMERAKRKGVMQDAKRRKRLQTVHANSSAVKQMTDEKMQGTSASARTLMSGNDSDVDDSDLLGNGCSILLKASPPLPLTESPKPECPTPESPTRPTSVQQQFLQEMRADRGAALEAYEQFMAIADRQAKTIEDLGATLAAGQDKVAGGMEKITVVLERMAAAQERHNLFLESLLQRVTCQFGHAQSGLDVASGTEMSPENHRDESITEQIKDGETVAEDITAENTVVTDEAPFSYHPVLEMDSEELPASNVPVYTVISSPSRISPVIKQCTKEQPVGSSTNETNSAPSIKGKTEEKKIVLRLRRLIPWLPNTTHTNDRSHMRSLDGSISTGHCIDEPAVENVMFTAQAIGCKDRLGRQPIDSTYDEDMCAAQLVGSCNAEIIPVAKPNDLLNKSSHADSLGYIKLNRLVNEKSVVCPNVKMPFAIQLKREITFLNKQSTKVPNTLGTIPSLSPLAQDVYGSTSGTCPSVSPLAQDVYGGTSVICPAVSPLPQNVYGSISETCPSVSSLAQDVCGGISETCPSVSPLAQDVCGGISEICTSVSPLAQDVYGGISETCPSVSPLAQHVYGGISGTCPSVFPLAQDVYDGTSVKCPSVSSPAQDIDGITSGICPSVFPFAQDVYGGTSVTCPSVSLAQDVHVGTSGTCPSVSSLAQDVYDGTSGTCPSISFAQDVHVDISGICPSVSSLTRDVYVSTSGTCLLVSPLAQDVHVEQPTTSLIGIDYTSLEDLPQAFTCPDVSAPETDREARPSHFLSPEKISEMSAKLVTGALSKQFNFSNIAMQIKSPIRSAKPSLSHSSNGTSSSSERFPPPASQLESGLPQIEMSSTPPSAQTVGWPGLKQREELCVCYSRLEDKVDSVFEEQKRLLSFLEVQQSEVNLVLKSMMATSGDSVERSCASPPLPTSSLPGTQLPCDRDQ